MKKKTESFFRFAAVCILASTVFTVLGWLYLKSELKPAENKAESVPYYTSVPENVGIMFELCGEKTLIYSDFTENTLTVVKADGADGGIIYGYSADFTVTSDYSLIGVIADSVGGINLERENVILSLTGSQLTELLSTTADGGELRKTVTEKIISEIGKNGFSREDFLFIIENSDTDLTVPDCFYWSDYIGEIFKNVRFLGYDTSSY